MSRRGVEANTTSAVFEREGIGMNSHLKYLVAGMASCFCVADATAHDKGHWLLAAPVDQQTTLAIEKGTFEVCFIGGGARTVQIVYGRQTVLVIPGSCVIAVVGSGQQLLVQIPAAETNRSAFGTVFVIDSD